MSQKGQSHGKIKKDEMTGTLGLVVGFTDIARM